MLFIIYVYLYVMSRLYYLIYKYISLCPVSRGGPGSGVYIGASGQQAHYKHTTIAGYFYDVSRDESINNLSHHSISSPGSGIYSDGDSFR